MAGWDALPIAQLEKSGRLECIALGHEVDADTFAFYPDGVVSCRCRLCACRIVLQRVPGGTPLVQARSLIEEIIASGQETGWSLHAISNLQEILKEERRALQESESLLRLAIRMVGSDEESA